MDTSNAQPLRAAAAAVIGSRHLRAGRNGQDAAFMWVGGARAAIVVCDGCSSGASSEVGARLGAGLWLRSLAARLARNPAGQSPDWPALWAAVRSDVVCALAELVERMPGDRAAVIREYLLFTIVGAGVANGEAAVWALGDGAYAIDGNTVVLGPFEDNQPPYLAYDLFGEPQAAHLEVAPPSWRSIVIATDGAAELGLDSFKSPRFVEHPDALRRALVVQSRSPEHIDWDARRVVHSPAALQDDGAIGVLHRWVR